MPIFRKVNKDFFKSWNSEMAYVLGFFAADGNIVRTKRDTHFLSFSSEDRNILCDIQMVMGSNHKLSERISETGKVYRFQIGSKEMFDDLIILGFGERKSSRMLVPNIPSKYRADFIRGYFDGDGNVWLGFINKDRQTPTNVLQVTFTSGSKEFINGLLVLLKKIGIKGGSIYTPLSKNFSRLQLSTLDALKLGKIMYNGQPKLHLKRKKLRFDTFRKSRNNCGGSSTG